MRTTSRRQGRRREAASEGSPRQSCDLTDRKVIRGRVPGASWHKTAKPSGSGDTVNDPGVQRPFTSLSGETCLTGGPLAMGAGLRTIPKGMEQPPDPTAAAESAREVGLRTTGKPVDEPPNPTALASAALGNRGRDEAGVSRGHSSHRPAVMGRMGDSSSRSTPG